jgi:hypothetical protein
MSEYSATRLIQQKITQFSVTFQRPGLFPQILTRRRRNPADNDIPNLAFRMATDYMNTTTTSHSI